MSLVAEKTGSRFPTSYREPARGQVNVAAGERWLSAAAGMGLLAVLPIRRDKLGLLAALAGGALLYRGAKGQCQVYRAFGKNSVQPYSTATGVRAKQGVKFEKSLIINRPPEAIYNFWRDLKHLPLIIDHLRSVEEVGDRSRWTACGPFDQTMEWEATFIDERPHELIAWRSIPESDVDTAGSLRLEPLSFGRGTAVRLALKYDPPGGKTAISLASLLGIDVESELTEGLRRMKQILEAGELPTTEGQPQGTCSMFGSHKE